MKFFRYSCSISILALVWRATCIQCNLTPKINDFNPRPRVEGDQSFFQDFRPFQHFNPRPRVEGDIHSLLQSLPVKYFNPRPRVEGDRKFIQKSALFQE